LSLLNTSVDLFRSKARLSNTRFHDNFLGVFELDLRSLAALRICVGLLLLIDLIWRAQDLVAHYTDFGVLPRSVLVGQSENRWFFSFHLINGTWQVQAVLFCIAAAFALALVAGYKTRLVTFVSWLLLISLQSRNPVIGEAGDVLLRMLVFWGMFLPWGICYSMDRAECPEWETLPNRCLSWATFAYIAQILMMYWFSAVLKSGPQWRSDFTAAYFTLSIDQMTTSFGQYWLQFPRLLELVTAAVFWFEIVGPLLLISPFLTAPLRLVSLLGFFLMHMSFFLCLDLGLFPWIACVSLLGFVPSSFWDKISDWLATREERGLKIHYDEQCGFCTKSVRMLRTFLLIPRSQLVSAQSDPSVASDMQRHNSWVVMTDDGTRHFSFEAGATLFHASPILRPIGSLLATRALQPPGERLYRLLANHRRVSCRVRPPVGDHCSVLRLGPFADFLVPLFLLYVLLWNSATLPGSPLRFSERSMAVGLMLHLDQAWNMFAPFPFTDDGWYVIPGKLANGDTVDLFNNGSAVSWDKPFSVLNKYKNYRWRKYMETVYESYYRNQREDYAKYLCRSWNAHHSAKEAVKEFSIYYLLERTTPNYQPTKIEKLFLLNYRCGER
jgi:hypothetical protein